MSSIPDDQLAAVASMLGPIDILNLRASCSSWRVVTELPDYWESHCRTLWSDKAYVPLIFKQSSPKSFKTYFESIYDSRRLKFDGEEELCQQHFHFRFKLAAGDFWASRDTSFYGGIPMYRRFLLDGRLSHLPPEDVTAPSCSTFNPYAVAPAKDALESDPEISSFIPSITWKFTKSQYGRPGQFIQLNRWPSYVITRALDWGWCLESEWVKYRSCSPETLGLGPEWMSENDDDNDLSDDDVENDDFWSEIEFPSTEEDSGGAVGEEDVV
jgi:hypothetical protein